MSEAKLMMPLFYSGNFNADGKRIKAVFEREVSNGTDAYRLWRSALEKEDEAIRRLGSDSIHQADHIKKIMDKHVSTYLTARENGGESFPDFIGAAVLNELALCRDLSATHKAKKRAEDLAWQAKVKAEEKKRREETNLQAERQMLQALHVLRCGGILQNDSIQFYREDGGFGKYSIVNHLMRRYGVDVPLRTQGWINDKLVSFTVENGRCENLRYMRAKNGRCSQKVFECVNALIQKVNKETEAAA